MMFFIRVQTSFSVNQLIPCPNRKNKFLKFDNRVIVTYHIYLIPETTTSITVNYIYLQNCKNT